MAVRVPVVEAFALYAKGADRIIAVSDDEVAEAMRIYYSDTHNLAEGAGAAPLAALLKEQDKTQGKEIGVILSGGNVDLHVYAAILAGKASTLSSSREAVVPLQLCIMAPQPVPVWSKYWSEASISSIENLIALITVPVPHRRPG
jgi:threonine dehydratase